MYRLDTADLYRPRPLPRGGVLTRLKARLEQWLPRPDPDFDPIRATGARTPRVREIVLQIGPTPGAAHRRGLDGPSGLAWG